MASVSDANDARSTVDPGGTLEASATDSAVAPTLASQDAPPQEWSGDVDVLLSTARSVSPQGLAEGGDAAVSVTLETSSSGIGAVDIIPAHPRPSSLHSPIPSPRPSLVGGATAPAVVETNSTGDAALQSHGLPNDVCSGHPRVNDLTVEALIKMGSSDSGVVAVHGTTSLRGASGARISGRPQDSGASKRVTATAAGETGSSDTGGVHVTLTPLPPLSARSSMPTRGSAVVVDSVIPAVVDASSDSAGAVNVDTSSALCGLSLPLPNPSTSRPSVNNHMISGLDVEDSPIPHGAAECAATSQLQEVAELLKHAGNLLSRIGISNTQHVHVRESDCKCTACSCACAQNPRSCPSISEDARALSAAAATTSSRGKVPDNQPADSQDHPLPGPPPKDSQDTQQPASAAQQVPSGSQALPGQLTGWAAVEKALKEFDQQEIGGYKEDIDSLLTFVCLCSTLSLPFLY